MATAILPDRPRLRERTPRQPLIPYVVPALKVSTRDELDRVLRFRYQVFCQELGFWDPADYPDGRERDEFDARSIHFAAHDGQGEIVGTVRLVLSGPFPLEGHCPLFPNAPSLAGLAVGEISRLAIGTHVRRNKSANSQPNYPVDAQALRKRLEIVISLYKGMLLESKRLGLTHWLAAMEKSLHRVLAGLGCRFVPIGPEVDYSGPVTPYLASIATIEREQCMTRLN